MENQINPIKSVLNSPVKTGRRKTSIATVQLIRGNGEFTINGIAGIQYMHNQEAIIFAIQEPLQFLKLKNDFNIIINVKGGGLVGQVNAIKLGVARALCEFDSAYRNSLKLKGFLTRDPRCKERKKYGLKKARKAPQFSKR